MSIAENIPANDMVNSPVKNAARIQSLDVIRGIAVLGILIMNIIAHALPFEAYGNPLSYGVQTAADGYAWIISNLFANGTMRSLFSILFGVSIILLTQNKEKKVAKRFFIRRCLFLALFGLFHAHVMLFFGDILFSYAIVGMVIFFWQDISIKTTYIIITLFILLSLILFGFFALVGANVPEAAQEMALEIARIKTLSLVQIIAHSGTYLDAFKVNSGISIEMQTINILFLFIDVAPLMLLGFNLYRTGFITGKKSCGCYVKAMIIGLVIGTAVNGYLIHFSLERNFDMPAQMFFMSIIDFSRIALSISFISMVHIIMKMGVLKSVINALASIGKMALSCYLAQSLIALILFNGFGFDLYNKFGRAELMIFVVGIWAILIIFSHFWLKSYKYGPAEWLWRSLSYGRKLSIRKES